MCYRRRTYRYVFATQNQRAIAGSTPYFPPASRGGAVSNMCFPQAGTRYCTPRESLYVSLLGQMRSSLRFVHQVHWTRSDLRVSSKSGRGTFSGWLLWNRSSSPSLRQRLSRTGSEKFALCTNLLCGHGDDGSRASVVQEEDSALANGSTQIAWVMLEKRANSMSECAYQQMS